MNMISKIKRKKGLYSIPLISVAIIAILALSFCNPKKKVSKQSPGESIETNVNGTGIKIELTFIKGKEHNHPLMAIWTEDMNGNYLETLFIAESIGTGTFDHAVNTTGDWEPGLVRRPAALPYWGHKYGYQAKDGYYLPDPENPTPDAITRATPTGNFTLKSKASQTSPQKFRLLMEINQSWDWNEFWTNNKYPDDVNYKTSSQPALVYAATIDLSSEVKEYSLLPIGHSHYSGADGSLNPDLSTLTTALKIVESVKVKIM